MPDLSILIPSRNEMFLSRTIEDILTHSNLDTEIIVVLDGAWADPPVADNPRLTLVHHSRSVGQRAACNEAARLARGKYVMKLDAHCAVEQGFDIKMLEAMEGHDDWTMVPVMRNHHAFDWLCSDGHRRYQGPSGPCKECGKPTTQDVVWIAKTNPQNTSYCVDSEPHFQYFGEFKQRPEYKPPITETMSLQGSCFLLTHERYFALNVCDEEYGSWGTLGWEVAAKTWLSGGRVVCNHNTWYAHLFRTQGGDFSFPYNISSRQSARAKKLIGELFFENKWPQQTRPLSWLLDHFWPVGGWSDEARAKITAAGAAFSRIHSERLSIPRVVYSVPNQKSGSMPTPVSGVSNTATDQTNPGSSIDLQGKNMPAVAMGLPSTCGSNSIMTVDGMIVSRSKLQMEGIATPCTTTDMMKDRNGTCTWADRERSDQPCVHEPVTINEASMITDMPVSPGQARSGPHPAASCSVDVNLRKDSDDVTPRQQHGVSEIIRNSHSVSPIQGSSVSELARAPTRADSLSIPRKTLVYYSDLKCDPKILTACQRQLDRCRNGSPLISVSLKPIDFGDRNIVLDAERSAFTMFRQILAGIEASTADVLWLCEHDCLYHPSHFDFVPPRRDTFYYDVNQWNVSADDGRALFYRCQKVSMLCAYRELLLEHYRTRVARVEKEGFTLRLGYEPGNHRFPRGVDMHGREDYWAAGSSIDIRHKQTFTPNRFRKEQFRNQRNLKEWTEADEVPGWGVTKGRFDEFLQQLI